MAYTPTVWKDGDVVTSARLNKIEEGIANNEPFIVTQTYDEQTDVTTLNATWQDIVDAVRSGNPAFVLKDTLDSDDPYISMEYVCSCLIENGIYIAYVNNIGSFYAQSPTEQMTNQEPISDDSGSPGEKPVLE